MKHPRLARCLPWLLIAVCPPLLGHCGGAVEHGTETGNPPVVEQQKLHVVLHDDGVVVLGDPGAVSPGATVTVTNVRSGDRSEATAGADGSVSVGVPGTLADEYEVTVSSGGRSQTVRVLASAGTSDAAGASGKSGNELASASCDALEQNLRAQVADQFAAASTACQVDSDCTWGGDVGCYYTCGGPIVSVGGLAAAQRAILESTAPVCAELTSRCPGRGPPGCPALAGGNPTLGCSNGSCEVLSCDDLQSRMNQRLSEIQEQVPRDCAVDADCTLINPRVGCLTSCGTQPIVQAGSSDQTTPLVKRADDSICGAFELQGCPAPIPPPCGATTEPRAACVSGKCDIEYVPRF